VSEPSSLRGAAFGLLAAALFGASTPIAKLLLRSVEPTLLAGLLYLGAALGLWLVRLVRPATDEPPLRRGDLPRLLLVVASGGVAGPVLMLLGLERLGGFSGSLLLNLEAPFTMLLAVLLFGEHLSRRAALAALCIVAGALVLRLEPGQLAVDGAGMLFIAAACLCWALDNNLTQRLSVRDPFAVVRFKASGAALTNLLVAFAWLEYPLPSPGVGGGALLLGCVSYGISVVLDAYALRLVGAAREAAYFATAPFLGALLSVLLLGESLGLLDALAMVAMVGGVVLMLRERHSHLHVHEPLEHEHLHVHDAHHQHGHPAGELAEEPHSHRHQHARLEHEHPHVSDLHHRHRHRH
jgi:drug/metabolite transporter (DMT)-like permease